MKFSLLLLFALILLTLSQQNLQQLEDLESHANDVLDVASIFAKNSEDTESTATLAVPQTIYTPYAQPGQVLVTQPPADTFYGIPSAFVGMMVGFFFFFFFFFLRRRGLTLFAVRDLKIDGTISAFNRNIVRERINADKRYLRIGTRLVTEGVNVNYAFIETTPKAAQTLAKGLGKCSAIGAEIRTERTTAIAIPGTVRAIVVSTVTTGVVRHKGRESRHGIDMTAPEELQVNVDYLGVDNPPHANIAFTSGVGKDEPDNRKEGSHRIFEEVAKDARYHA